MMARQIAVALRGTVLSGLPVRRDVGGAVVVQRIDTGRILESWRAARALVDVTGRWPVMIGPEQVYGDPDRAELAEFRRAATEDDPWSVYRPDDEARPADWLLSALDPALHDRAARESSASGLERWVYDRAVDDPASVRLSGDYSGLKQWYVPRGEVHLALLPTTSQWLAPGWLQYFGAGSPARKKALAGAMYQWEQRFGAELVAWWDTMLQWVVSSPPAAGGQAWELAGQHKAVGGSLQMPRWELAVGLSRSDAWFLHDRP